jgi:PGF-CTERM protein
MAGRTSLVALVLSLLVCTGPLAPVVAGTSASVGSGPADASVRQTPDGGAVGAAKSAATRSQMTTTEAATESEATTSTGGESGDTESNESAVAEKVAPSLLDGSGRLRRNAGETAAGTASAQSTETADRLPVVVELAPEAAKRGREAVRRTLGGDAVVASHGRLVQATATREELTELAALSVVSYVRPPATPVSLAGGDGTTEGVEAMNLSAVHDTGYTGENVTVAVVDVDPFEVDDPAFADRVVATKDFTGRGVAGTGGHGTATAELVAETAPNASLVFVRVNSEVGLYEAVDWLEANTSTDVVSMSLGWYNVGALNGTSPMDREISRSVENGTTWVVSAGNSGRGKHWNGTWTDPDGDGRLNVDGDREYFEIRGTASGGYVPVRVYASWRDWPRSDDDYDVCLYDDPALDDTDLVRCTGNPQTGTQDPAEGLTGYLADDGDGYETLYLTVERRNADGRADFDVFLGDGLSFRRSWTDARSLAVPATNPHVVTVGAVDAADGRVEPYSSHGPTVDGRQKPDVVAPDNVTSSVYDRFRGTSASAPQVAGVAAVLLDANGRLSAGAVKSSLRTGARSVGDGVTDAAGYGVVDAERSLAALRVYDLPPDGRLRFDGRYRLVTGGNAVPSSLVVSADDAVLDGDGRTFAGGDTAVVVAPDAGGVSVTNATLTADETGLDATGGALDLRDVTLSAPAALAVADARSVDAADARLDGRVAVRAGGTATLENVTAARDATVEVSNGSFEARDARFERDLVVDVDGPATLRNVTVTDDVTLTVSNGSLDATGLAVGNRPAFGVAGRNVTVTTDETVPEPEDRLLRSATPTVRPGANGTATLTLRYDPERVDESTAAVWVRENGTWSQTEAQVDADADVARVDVDEEGTYAVLARGVPVADDPTQVDVEATVGSTETTMATVPNDGTADLTVTGANLSGPDAAQFGFDENQTEMTVPPGGEAIVTVTYSPNHTGEHVATLVLSTVELGPVEVRLVGTATGAEATETETPTPTATETSDATPTAEDTATPTPEKTATEEPASVSNAPAGGGGGGGDASDDGGGGDAADDGDSAGADDDGDSVGSRSDDGATDDAEPTPQPTQTRTVTPVQTTVRTSTPATPAVSGQGAADAADTDATVAASANAAVAADSSGAAGATAETDSDAGSGAQTTDAAETPSAVGGETETETELPGFGAASAVAALLTAAVVVARRPSRE